MSGTPRHVVFLFPGQGMEEPRMGLAMAASYPAAEGLLHAAAEVTGVDLSRALRRGGRDMQRTEVLQPVLTAVALGAFYALVAAGVRPQAVAGHSLGELPAWAAIGAIEPEEAVALAGARGRLMGREATRNPGQMSALMADRGVVAEALAVGRREGVCDLAAHNAPREWVLSGEREALSRVAATFPARPLPTVGAWHSRLMTGAQDEVQLTLERAARRPEYDAATSPVFVCNRLGAVASADDLPQLLAEQLTHPVEWATTLTTLTELGGTDFVTVGPGRILRGLVRKNLGEGVRVHTAENPDDLARTVTRLREEGLT